MINLYRICLQQGGVLMLEFMMNPSFSQDFIIQLSWLGPWAVVLLTIIKMLFIAIGSLLLGSLFLVLGILVYTVYTWSRHKLVMIYQPEQKGKRLGSPIINNKNYGPPELPRNYPHLAA